MAPRRIPFCAGLAAVALASRALAAPAPPSLEGLWTNATTTQLERPPVFGQLTATPEQAAAWRAGYVTAFRAQKDAVGSLETEWFEIDAPMTRVAGQFRTSLIVEPASGHLPYTEKGRLLALTGLDAITSRLEGPEVRPAPERCLAGFMGAAGAPMLPASYNANYRIVQTADTVVISIENGGELRIIRLGQTAHLPRAMTPWGGDSIGRWEGRTLVVETTNFNPGETLRAPRPVIISPEAKVTERFTPTAEGEILYAFTVEDPAIYRQAWTGEQVFRPSTAREFEYACHEGNYSLPGVLAGARRQEAEAWRPPNPVRVAGGS